MVQHCHLDLIEEFQHRTKSFFPQHKFNDKETEIIDNEIMKLLKMGVIVKTVNESDQFVSPIFIRKKKNNEFRMVLNLKWLNQYIPYHHFKMDTFEKALTLVKKDMFFCSVDLRHAYYSVPVAKEHQKYLKFKWNNNLYMFTCFPNGLALCPRYFTKLLKPVYAKLRNEGHTCSGFIDDSLLCGDSNRECKDNCEATQSLFKSVGFTINYDKSVLIPSQQITFLGNNIDSHKMIVTLPEDKVSKIKQECGWLISVDKEKIRTVASIIGMLVASFSAVQYGKMHYRILESQKIKSLKFNKGDYEARMRICPKMKLELKWWVNNIDSQFRKITQGNPDITIQTDASLMGYGMASGPFQWGEKWSEKQKSYHINVLELLAILMALKSFKKQVKDKHVRILTDSTTAMAYVNNMRGHKSQECNAVSIDIWNWCIKNNVWVSCNYIPGVMNEADKPSRKFDNNLEWMLDKSIFERILDKPEKTSIDLFASKLNKQLPIYCTWKRDQDAKFIDAMSLNWKSFSCAYIFAPFSLLSNCVQKIVMDQARALIVCPLWPTQVFFTEMMKILVKKPIILPRRKTLLSMPGLDITHPLIKNKRLTLVACLVSGNRIETEAFQRQLPVSSCPHGGKEPRNSTRPTLNGGYSIVVKNKLLQFQRL